MLLKIYENQMPATEQLMQLICCFKFDDHLPAVVEERP
jgi:hypothetical protein